MRTWVVVAVLALTGCGSEAATLSIDEPALRAEIMQDDAAQDFLITETGAVYVGMLDNGNDRKGYARYVCETVRAHSSGEGHRLVKIIDIAAVSRGDGFKDLGRHRCQL